MYALRAPETKRQYPRRLAVVLDFLKFEGSLAVKAANFLITAKENKAWAEDSFMKFIEHQKKRFINGEIVGSTVSNYYKATKLFCEMNDLVLNWKKIARGLPRSRKAANDRAPTNDEIKKLLEYPDRRIKPIIYVMASSGIRVGAWDDLQWKHVSPISNDKGDIIAARLTIYPGDIEEYYTFVTPEACLALEEWKKFRIEYGEEITGDSWVMRDIWQTSNMKYGAKFGLATNPKKLESVAITRILERAAWEQGVRTKLPSGTKRHPWKVVHGFRKWFKTRAQLGGMDTLNVEFLMGHDTGLGESYYKPTEKEMLEKYLLIIHELTVFNDASKVQKKISELQKRSSDNENMLKARLQEKDDQLEKILQRQDELEAQQVQFMEILRAAKLKNGRVGENAYLFVGEDRTVKLEYVDDSNHLRKVKIPVDALDFG